MLSSNQANELLAVSSKLKEPFDTYDIISTK